MRILDKVLDSSVFYSFDHSGFMRHQKEFDPNDLKLNLKNKICMVTGANSGLGFETAKNLAERGAEVILVCRNRERGEEALGKIEGSVRLEILDVSDLQAVQSFVSRLSVSHIDVLIHNAGNLPAERHESRQRNELVFATHVLGPFLLTRLLLPKLKASKSARVIFVSSGGMYAQKLDLANIQAKKTPYDGVVAYANAKRAQVILTELWSQRFPAKEITFNSMHPGWVNTPGVKNSLPRFWKFMKKRLRKPKEGADTITWLAVCERIGDKTGKLWFDRRAVSTHLLPWTHESSADRSELWELCETLTRDYSLR